MFCELLPGLCQVGRERSNSLKEAQGQNLGYNKKYEHGFYILSDFKVFLWVFKLMFGFRKLVCFQNCHDVKCVGDTSPGVFNELNFTLLHQGFITNISITVADVG